MIGGMYKVLQIHKMYGSDEVQDLQQLLHGLTEVQTRMVHFLQPEKITCCVNVQSIAFFTFSPFIKGKHIYRVII